MLERCAVDAAARVQRCSPVQLGAVGSQDCCTQWIWDENDRFGTETYLKERAFFNISYIKDMLTKAKDILGYDLLQLCLEGPEDKLEETRYCQPAMFLAGLAAVEKLKSDSPEHAANYKAAAGLSLGEYTALCVAGAFTFEGGSMGTQAIPVHRFATLHCIRAQGEAGFCCSQTLRNEDPSAPYSCHCFSCACYCAGDSRHAGNTGKEDQGIAEDPGSDLQGPIFVHIPKTAGTSIWKALGSNFTDSGRYPEVPFFCMKHNPPQDRRGSSSSLREEHVPDSWAVVRDPCDRLVSEFAWARLQGWYNRLGAFGLSSGATVTAGAC
eukprot:s510_g14.t1